VHRCPAGAKLAGAIALVLFVVLLPARFWLLWVAVAAALVGLAAFARLSPARLLGRLLWLEPFALGIALLALAGPAGPAAFTRMLARSTLCLATVVLLGATTRFTDLLAVLWRCRLPALLVTTIALMYRYLFVLAEEAGRMSRARRSRTFSAARTVSWRTSASVASQLFVRAAERAERIYAAMCARGWKT